MQEDVVGLVEECARRGAPTPVACLNATALASAVADGLVTVHDGHATVTTEGARLYDRDVVFPTLVLAKTRVELLGRLKGRREPSDAAVAVVGVQLVLFVALVGSAVAAVLGADPRIPLVAYGAGCAVLQLWSWTSGVRVGVLDVVSWPLVVLGSVVAAVRDGR